MTEQEQSPRVGAAPPRLVEDILYRLSREVADGWRGAELVSHPGEGGRARENIIASTLRRFVPDAFGVSTGFVIDAVGGISRQQDIIIHRRGYHPTFTVGGIDHFMVESVAAVIQSKASVKSTESLLDALDTVASVKKLDRTNRGTNYIIHGSSRGEDVSADNYQHQVWGAIVTAASLAPQTLGETMAGYLAVNDKRHWTNVYADVNGRAGLFQMEDSGTTDNPGEAVAWAVTMPEINQGKSVPPLVELFGHLANFLRVTPLVDYKPMSYFPKYIGTVRRWPLPEAANAASETAPTPEAP